MKIKEILESKGSRVVTIEQNVTVFDAMTAFAANRVGSLLVVDKNDNILGIIGARDVLMACISSYDDVKSKPVSDIMTTNIIVAKEEDDVEYLQAVMTENRIRHVPIIEGGELKGIVSIGDVVKALMNIKEVEIHYLKEYIADKYPG